MSPTSAPAATTYTVAFPRPATHLFELTAHFRGLPDDVRFALPAWTPGSYRIRDYARHVQDLEALSARDLRPLRAEKVDKSAWRVDLEGEDEAILRWRVYANELTVRTAHLDDRHAYWNGAALFLRPETAGGQALGGPVRVEVEPPDASWRAATPLPADPPENGARQAFRAKDHDELVDSPFCVSPHQDVLRFEAAGVPHEIAICGGGGNYDRDRLAADTARIVEAEAALMGGLPASLGRYVFFVHLVPEGAPGGGLEHEASCSLQWGRQRFRPKDKYEDFLALVSHEYFHLWNGKRVRPRELGPFDYAKENFTRALWVVEGVTSYYDELLLVRAGLVDADWLLRKTADHLQNLEDTPGRRHQSLEEASFDAWIKFYQKNEHSVNATVSYYEKGQVIAWLLDLEIRTRSGGRRSLDDVVRALWRDHEASGGGGYDLARFEALCAEAAGADLRPFFDAYARGTADPDYARALAPFGLELVEEPRKDGDSRADGAAAGEPRAWLGARVKAEAGGRTVVLEVLEGSPAWEAGLNAMDEVLALDGFKVSAEALDARIQERRPGAAARLTVFRGDELREVRATLGAKKPVRLALRPARGAGEAETARREAWLGAPGTSQGRPTASVARDGAPRVGAGDSRSL